MNTQEWTALDELASVARQTRGLRVSRSGSSVPKLHLQQVGTRGHVVVWMDDATIRVARRTNSGVVEYEIAFSASTPLGIVSTAIESATWDES